MDCNQAPLSMEFSRQEYWSGLPCPPPGYLPNPGIELGSFTSAALAVRFLTATSTVRVLVAQSCLTLSDPMDCSPPGFSVHGIVQARILEWVSISLSRESSQSRDWTQISRTAGRLFTIWATREAQLIQWNHINMEKLSQRNINHEFAILAMLWRRVISIILDRTFM